MEKWCIAKIQDSTGALAVGYPLILIFEGIPEVLKLPEPDRVYSSLPVYWKKYSTQERIGAFIIEKRILKVNKHYAFPLIVQTKEGNLNNDIITERLCMEW